MLSKIVIASDHAGYQLKEQLCAYLKSSDYDVLDLGTDTDTVSVDYPLKAQDLAYILQKDTNARGILICGTGIGMCMAVNRYPFIRGALVYNEQTALLARQHNDANVLCLGGRTTDFDTAKKFVDIFLTTPFDGGRHEKRVLELGEMK